MFSKTVLGVFIIAVLSVGAFTAFGQLRAQDLTPQERAALEAQYAELQKEIAAQQQIIKDTQAKKNTLQGDVTVLNAQIRAAQAQIDAKNIAIRQLSAQIAKKNVVIGQLTDRITRGKEALASILRQTQVLDDYSVVSVALGAQDVSDFFSDLDAFTSIKTDLQTLFADIRSAKAQTESEKADLATKQNQTADAKYVIETQKQQISSNKTQKQQLLAITTNQEVEYKKILADRQAKAAAIRAALFPLRDAAAIQFNDALTYAKEAQAKTGGRPAGIRKNTGAAVANVMKPSRDIPPFTDLGLRLGFDPSKQVVSCPQSSGYGGAMGPAQFIPSTWRVYEARIAATTRHSVPNPWDAEDAIAAMSLYLADLGADVGGYTAEHRAAAKYYAGGAWATAGRVYANSVIALAKSIQSNIDFLASN